MAHGILTVLLRLIEVRRSRKQLAKLSDESLRDIGLSRTQVEVESARPAWDSVSFKNSCHLRHTDLAGHGRAPIGNSFRS